MILGIIGAVTGAVGTPVAVASAPNSAVSTATSVVGVSQGTAGQQGGSSAGSGPDPADDPRLAKFTLIVQCDENIPDADEIHGMQVVLRNNKLYLDEPDPSDRHFPDGHPFSGFYLEYPTDGKPLALVSTIQPDPPELNWIYANRDTLELTYGNKTQSLPHIFAPWDWTEDMQAVTLEGWEGFVALEESEDNWILCYDRNNDHLESLRGTRRIVECSLRRSILK